ncbi:MAG: Ig-like domain-containing protein [Candidatus Binataceae bacterium]
MGRIRSFITRAAIALIIGIYAAPVLAAASTVVIKSPANDTPVSGTVTVVATVGAGVWWAKLYIDGKGGPVSPPYSFSWNSITVANGTHVLTVAAFAKGGTTPLSTASINVVVANVVVANDNNQASTAYFGTLAPNTALPTDEQCAAQIAATPETIPGNSASNNFSLTASDLGTFYSEPFWFNYKVPSYTNRVTGAYAGSTDMILRWAACKWGIDEDVMRAEASLESEWTQGGPTYTATNHTGWGDNRRLKSQCETPAWDGWLDSPGECWQSCGIFQDKVFDFNVWPAACQSTAFNADFRMAYQRACMDGNGPSWFSRDVPTAGYPTYPNGNSNQMFWGCMGAWFSGSWYDADALRYIAQVQNAVVNKLWP